MSDDRGEAAAAPTFYLRDLPSYEAIAARTARYPDVDPAAVEATYVLFRVSTDGLAAFEAFLGRHGCSIGRFTPLAVLNRDPDVGLAPSVLAERCGVTRATMTGLLDGLERDKLVRRLTNRGDRRMVTVVLTAKGREFMDGLLPDYYRRVAALMGKMTHDEKRLLVDLVKKVNEGIPAVTA
ncbi:MAG TPA: MarR family transcriptional regulator [Tepidisphaeraceae bacterium]|nr:MarR family transcriptional regulator [Tepidisphaeraceae bacterium]